MSNASAEVQRSGFAADSLREMARGGASLATQWWCLSSGSKRASSGEEWWLPVVLEEGLLGGETGALVYDLARTGESGGVAGRLHVERRSLEVVQQRQRVTWRPSGDSSQSLVEDLAGTRSEISTERHDPFVVVGRRGAASLPNLAADLRPVLNESKPA